MFGHLKRSSISTRITRNSQLLHVPLFKTATGQRTFYYRMVSLWNALPQYIKLSQSLAHFKTLMRKRLLMDNFWFFFFFNFYHILNFSIHLNFYSHRSNLIVFYCVLYISLKSPLGTWNKCMYVCMYVTPKATSQSNNKTLTFIVCKLELWGKAMVLQCVLGAHVLGQQSTTMSKTEGRWCATKQQKLRKACGFIIFPS